MIGTNEARERQAQFDLPITLAEMIAEVHREISVRRHVYINLVNKGRLKQDEADRRIRVMEAVLATLSQLRLKEGST